MITADDIAKLVALALAEDIGAGDVTAELVGSDVQASGSIVTRERRHPVRDRFRSGGLSAD